MEWLCHWLGLGGRLTSLVILVVLHWRHRIGLRVACLEAMGR